MPVALISRAVSVAIVAVSAHLDDAALSASAALADAAATVVTVFAGPPPEGLALSPWDRFTGAASSAGRILDRRAEDEAAMRLLRARPVHLIEPEIQYRETTPDLSDAAGELAGIFRAADLVWLPAAIGGHLDHVLARDAGLRAAAMAGHAEVVLYADFPYVIAFGWPAAATGRRADAYLDVDYWLARELTKAGLDPSGMTLSVTRLSPAQRDAKAALIAAYRSQAAALRLAPADLAAEPAKLDYELSWRLPLPGSPPG